MPRLAPEKVRELEETLPELEEAMSYSLADAVREGATVTTQTTGWGNGRETACALTAAALAARARHLI